MTFQRADLTLTPPPARGSDAEAWRAIADQAERLRAGLRALYDWYARNESLVACVLRDAEVHPLVREITDLRFGPVFARYGEVLGAKLGAKQRALLALALSFHTWRTLTRNAGTKQSAAVGAMVETVMG